MGKTIVYIGYMQGKGLFHVYETDIEYGITFFINKNLGDLVKDVVRVSNQFHDKVVPKICRYKSFVFK